MPNEYFSPNYSSDEVYRGQDMSICLTDELDNIDAAIAALQSNSGGSVGDNEYASLDHTHDEYALANHTHNEYAADYHVHNNYALAADVDELQALVGDTDVSVQIATAISSKADVDHIHTDYASETHTHSEYAKTGHTHDDYATSVHSHAEYAAESHSHSYNDLSNLPTALPANGGNADTIDGKHASDFALATDVTALQTKIGDTAVSAQISAAINAIDHPVDSVNGKTGAIVLTASDVGAMSADIVIPSIAGLATESYVDTKVANLIDSSPDTLNTLNELAAALGDDPNFATTVATQIGGKVDKIDGKYLSSNDYTNAEKTKLAGIETGANNTVVDSVLSSTSSNPVQNKVVSAAISNLNTLVGDTSVASQISTAIAGKVDAVSGKGLSTNDYTTSEKTKLSGIATGAEVNQNTFSNVVVGSTTIAADTKTDTLTIAAGSNITLTPDATNDKITIAAQDTTYSAATTSAAGLMSAADKTKLDGITAGANAYTLPTASSSTLGGVKTTSTVTSNSGYTACPIISGVPYYKDTDTTYNLGSFGVTATATELNYVDGVTSNIQTQLNGKAASSHGTHVTFTTTTPKVAGTAAVGSATTVSRSDHVHPAQTTVSGNAGSATKLATARTIRTNLASTSTASFDGSGNVTPGVTGTLPIANGGTGATTAAGIVSNLGISDYVVAQGTNGIWTYRKWNSGIAECWGNTTINYQIDCTTQRANAVYTDDTFKGSNVSLPSGLFTSVSFATANARTNGYTIAQVSNLTTTALSYRVWCPYSTLLASGSVIEFSVKGKWK